MGSVINHPLFTREKKIHLAIFVVYFIAAFAFLTIGLQPIKDAGSVYAAEAATATESLSIPEIGLSTPVKIVSVTGADLEVPEQIVGSYSSHPNKTLLIGHSSTVFKDLKDLKLNSIIIYNDKTYSVLDITKQAKSDISMKDILKSAEKDTLVLMTCSGEAIAGTDGDHTHRLIITAEKR